MSFAKRQTGISAIEFTLILPVMLVVLSLVYHIGTYFYWQHQLEHAAQRWNKILVLEYTKQRSFNTVAIEAVHEELRRAFPKVSDHLGIRFNLVSDVPSRNVASRAKGVLCFDSPSLGTINQLTPKVGNIKPRNIALLSLCLRMKTAFALSAFSLSLFENGLGDLSVTAAYPVSNVVFQ